MQDEWVKKPNYRFTHLYYPRSKHEELNQAWMQIIWILHYLLTQWPSDVPFTMPSPLYLLANKPPQLVYLVICCHQHSSHSYYTYCWHSGHSRMTKYVKPKHMLRLQTVRIIIKAYRLRDARPLSFACHLLPMLIRNRHHAPCNCDAWIPTRRVARYLYLVRHKKENLQRNLCTHIYVGQISGLFFARFLPSECDLAKRVT